MWLYSNHWEKEQVPDDNLNLLEFCLSGEINDNDVAFAMFEFVEEEQTGLFIGEEYYEWEQITHLFQDKK